MSKDQHLRVGDKVWITKKLNYLDNCPHEEVYWKVGMGNYVGTIQTIKGIKEDRHVYLINSPYTWCPDWVKKIHISDENESNKVNDGVWNQLYKAKGRIPTSSEILAATETKNPSHKVSTSDINYHLHGDDYYEGGFDIGDYKKKDVDGYGKWHPLFGHRHKPGKKSRKHRWKKRWRESKMVKVVLLYYLFLTFVIAYFAYLEDVDWSEAFASNGEDNDGDGYVDGDCNSRDEDGKCDGWTDEQKHDPSDFSNVTMLIIDIVPVILIISVVKVILSTFEDFSA